MYVRTVVVETERGKFAIRVGPDGKPVDRLTPSGEIAWAEHIRRQAAAGAKELNDE